MPKRPLLVFLRQVTLGRFLFVSEIVASDSARDGSALLSLQRSVADIPIDATSGAQDQKTLDIKLLKNLAKNLLSYQVDAVEILPQYAWLEIYPERHIA